jgi:protein-S-isoprenylcysteine O-methyltransferase Ste14
LLIGLGLGLLLFKYWVTLVFLGIFFIRYVKLIFAEEKKLLKVFGNAYIDYCRQVPWLLPSLKSLFRRDVRFYLPVKPAWIYKEIGAIIATLVMLLLFWLWEGWRQ